MERDTRALTGIRGVAACWVMVHHFANGYDGMPAAHLFIKGYLAVDLFFALSGFVIALKHGSVFAQGVPSDFCVPFYRRRMARVYPLLMVATALTVAHRAIVGELFPSSLVCLLNLTMTQTWFAKETIVGSGWSVSVEVFAYLAAPWLLAFIFRQPIRVAAIAVFLAWGCLFWMTTLDPATSFGEADSAGPLDIYAGGRYPILRCLCGFIAGACAARLMLNSRVHSAFSTTGLPEALLAGIVILAWWTELDVVVAALFVPLVCALAMPGHVASRLFRSAPLLLLGDLSYAIYLLHFLVGSMVRDLLISLVPYPIVLVSCVLVSIAAAAGLHILVERPFNALVRSRSRKPLSVTTPVTV